MNKDKLIDKYKYTRQEFYNSGFVIGTKNKTFDFVVLGWGKDKYVKLVKPNQKGNIENYLYYMKGIANRRKNINIIYILIYLDENCQEEGRNEIIIK